MVLKAAGGATVSDFDDLSQASALSKGQLAAFGNANFRPVFDVLKPYFEKFLHSKTIDVQITLVIDSENIVQALSANSPDLDKLNREIIESVRFRFIEKNLTSKKFPMQTPVTENHSVLPTNGLYESDEQMLSDLLIKGNYKHHKELRFLAEKHEGQILKVRFILLPFAFVFLIAGYENYYLVLETLDSEEATYLWQIPKDIKTLKFEVRKIDHQLNQIRNEGRQKFLESNPQYFHKIMHDYTEDNRGFINWRDQLEALLY